MKPALVLGLALAANAFSAEVDNELIIAPTDQYGNIKFPGHIMYDEQADDELLVRPLSTHVADDELIVAPRDEFGNIKYPKNPFIRYDEDGNEFFVAPTHRLGELGHRILYDNELAKYAGDIKELLERQMEYKGRLDDEGDDELANYASEIKQLLERQMEYKGRMDDEGDDELVMAPHMMRRFDHIEGRKVYDDEADLELMRGPYMKRRHDDHEGRRVYDDKADNEQFVAPSNGGKYQGKYIMYDEQVDDELLMAPLDGTGKYHRRRFDDLTSVKIYDDEADSELLMSPFRRRFDDIEGKTVYDDELIIAPTDEFGRIKKFPGHIMYDEADHELRSEKSKIFAEEHAQNLRPTRPSRPAHDQEHPKPRTMGPKLFVNRPHVMTNDDEGDDELVYLGELIKNRKMDRFRDHELPEIKGRNKPVTEGGFLPVN